MEKWIVSAVYLGFGAAYLALFGYMARSGFNLAARRGGGWWHFAGWLPAAGLGIQVLAAGWTAFELWWLFAEVPFPSPEEAAAHRARRMNEVFGSDLAVVVMAWVLAITGMALATEGRMKHPFGRRPQHRDAPPPSS